jgi:hypothetical protein
VTRIVGIGSGKDSKQIRYRRVSYETLGSVQNISIAVAYRLRLQRRRFRAGIGFGQREASDNFAACDPRQIFALLLGRPVGNQRRAADPGVGTNVGTKRDGTL